MTVMTAPFLDVLKSATARADTDEKKLRDEFSQRLKSIEQERTFAYRRYNLMRAVADYRHPFRAPSSVTNREPTGQLSRCWMRAGFRWLMTPTPGVN